MPQRTQHCLVHVLLLWTIVLSITQVVFISLYFTIGRQIDLPHSVLTLKGIDHPKNSSDHDFGNGKMLTFQADGDIKSNQWLAKNPDENLVSQGTNLIVKRDGYYFLILQVTLNSCEKEHTVTLNGKNRILLEGLIHNKSCSTGLLGKADELSAGEVLEVTINPAPKDKDGINTKESATHLSIIYMPQP